MSKLLVKPQGPERPRQPCDAGKRRLDLCRLRPAPADARRDASRGETGDREVCLVFVTGKGKVTAGGKDLGELGERMRPFEGKPWSVYVPQGSTGR